MSKIDLILIAPKETIEHHMTELVEQAEQRRQMLFPDHIDTAPIIIGVGISHGLNFINDLAAQVKEKNDKVIIVPVEPMPALPFTRLGEAAIQLKEAFVNLPPMVEPLTRYERGQRSWKENRPFYHNLKSNKKRRK